MFNKNPVSAFENKNLIALQVNKIHIISENNIYLEIDQY